MRSLNMFDLIREVSVLNDRSFNVLVKILELCVYVDVLTLEVS